MALTTVKISELPLADDLDGLELIEIVQDGINKQATAAEIAASADVTVTLNDRDGWARHEMVFTRGVVGGFLSEFGTAASASGTQDSPVLSGATTAFAATSRRGFTSVAAINSAASQYETNCVVFAGVSGSARGAGFTATWRGGLGVARSDQKFLAGLAPISTTLGAMAVPSNTTNCLAFGKDEGDANLQIMYNNGGGACTKINTGVAFTPLAAKLLEIRISVPLGGGSARFQLINLETDVVLVDTIVPSDANFPVADEHMYWTAAVNTGSSTATAVSVYLSRLLIQFPLE